ncbi:MAG: cysteine--tRNA ligase [Bdellovibrionota bacterium]
MKQDEMRPIRLANTLTGKKEQLRTLEPGRLTMYSCGPTVYNYIHIGNLRGGLVADMFFRFFKRAGYEVLYVRNYTDVDDKIIKRATEEKTTSEAVSAKYTAEVEKDFAAAGMLEPTYKTTVTSHIPDIIAMIEKILRNGKAYVVDGEVLFSINKSVGYGKLSQKNIDELVAGMRVDVREKKQNPLDFTLWKPAKPGEPSWDSPWGRGRPGWHIECSAMASRWLGEQIDVHHGGEDLIFPHHENEIAQSEGASGKEPFVRYWLHHAFLTISKEKSKEKMSKSLGNIFTAREFLTKFPGEVARYMLLSVHYRAPIDFCDEAIESTLTSLHRIYEAKARAVDLVVRGDQGPGAEAGANHWVAFSAACDRARASIDEAFANDFNTAEALAVLFTLIREFNKTVSYAAGSNAAAPEGAAKLISIMEGDIGGVLGVCVSEPKSMLAELSRIRADRLGAKGVVRMPEAEIVSLIEERNQARRSKDFKRADQIRNELQSRGVMIKDGPGGTTWEYV